MIRRAELVEALFDRLRVLLDSKKRNTPALVEMLRYKNDASIMVASLRLSTRIHIYRLQRRVGYGQA
jgi:hypothetical protein